MLYQGVDKNMEEELGARLKSLRLKNKKTLKEISEKTNLSISFLSQVERFKSSVTLASLKKIADALDVTPSFFFDLNEETHPYITKQKEEYNFTNSPFIYIDLSKDIEKPIFEPALVVLSSGEINNYPYSHKGQEFIFVLKGTLSIILNDKKHYLVKGDSVHIDSSMKHIWFNETNMLVEILIVSSLN